MLDARVGVVEDSGPLAWKVCVCTCVTVPMDTSDVIAVEGSGGVMSVGDSSSVVSGSVGVGMRGGVGVGAGVGVRVRVGVGVGSGVGFRQLLLPTLSM